MLFTSSPRTVHLGWDGENTDWRGLGSSATSCYQLPQEEVWALEPNTAEEEVEVEDVSGLGKEWGEECWEKCLGGDVDEGPSS